METICIGYNLDLIFLDRTVFFNVCLNLVKFVQTRCYKLSGTIDRFETKQSAYVQADVHRIKISRLK